MERIKNIIKNIIKIAIPPTWRGYARGVLSFDRRKKIRIERERAHIQKLVASSADHLWNQTGGLVFKGPFKGMNYIRESIGSAWAPKLLGTYESELTSVIESILHREPKRVVDIGAAEGYYAIGFARKLRNAKVIAFEAQESGRKMLECLAAKNSVEDRIDIRGLCTHDELAVVLKHESSTVVICDVEGAELQLLAPDIVVGLRHACILVEVHPWISHNISEIIKERFELTHEIEEIFTRIRLITDLKEDFALFADEVLSACMNEMRPCQMSWLWMTPKTQSAA